MKATVASRKWGLFLLCILLSTPFAGYAIVLHPDGEPNLSTWTDKPDANVIGRWRGNASCVAISRNCVITTRHQGGLTGQVIIGTAAYEIGTIWEHQTADLRIAKLQNANLSYFVDIFPDGNEIGCEVVIGGFGKGRGQTLQSPFPYGYTWAGTDNSTPRWCTNKVDDTGVASKYYTSNVLVADFGPLGQGESTDYEGAIAEFDSGGGWFIKSSGQWKVAGLSRGCTDHSGESWFRPPDYIDAVRISSYAQWIMQTIPEPFPADLDGNDRVDLADLAVLGGYWRDTDCHAPDWCLAADHEPDGDVDLADLAFFAEYWLTGLEAN